MSPHDVRRVCVAAHVSPPTVRAYLAGHDGKASVRERIEAALRELGYDPADVRPEEDSRDRVA